MAVDRHVVGRVGEDHPRLLAVHQQPDDVRVERVAADQPVRPELPDIARPAARRPGLGQPVVLGIAGLLRRQPLDQAVDLRDREAGDADVEAEIVGEERLQLLGQQVLVPAGVQRQLVVGEHIGPLLGRRHGLDADAGHRRHAEELRRLDPAMAGEDGVLGVDQHRVGEAEGPDALGDLADLLLRVGAGVARPGLQSGGGDLLDRLGGGGVLHMSCLTSRGVG